MRTRFAPSPTGPLHLGHALSALTVRAVADAAGGEALLRIEDTDSTRCRSEHEAAIHEDLAWLGLRWDGAVRRQSEHRAAHEAAVDRLAAKGFVYPCGCTRREVIEAGGTPGLDGAVYPGSCRRRPMTDRRPGDAVRLDVAKALVGAPQLTFDETGPLHPGPHEADAETLIARIGDPVLLRKDTGDPAYHLAVTVDDAAQGITHVVRGDDLWHATWVHRLLQHALGLPVPAYHHHDLIRDEAGQRLAKIDGARALRAYREAGSSPEDVLSRIGWDNSTSTPARTAV